MKKNRNRIKKGATTAANGRSNDYDPFKIGCLCSGAHIKIESFARSMMSVADAIPLL